MKSLLLIALFSPTLALAAVSEWPGWRGDGTGISPARGIPLKWSATENVRWSAPLPGYGWSSPVVAGDRVFLTTAICDEQQPPSRRGPGGGEPAVNKVFRWEVHCLDRATGRTLWKQVAAERKPEVGNHISNTFASETPVTDGERVYAYFGMAGVVACYEVAGQPVWSRDLGAFKTFANWGSSSSPAFDGERVFIQCDNEGKSFLVALDRKTGKDVWRIARQERSTWSTPIIWRNAKRTEVVCMGSDYIRGYDPASGGELWRLASEKHLAASVGESAGGGRKTAAGGCKASPVASGDLLFVGMSAKSHGTELGPMWAVRAGASGDISLKPGETSNAGVAWFRDDAGPHFTSALCFEERLYVFPPHERGVLSCFDARTGAPLYAESLAGAGGFKASPCVVDGKIFCTDEGGMTFVIEAGPKFHLLVKNSLDAMSWASPAIAGGAIYLRTTDRLLCIASGLALPSSKTRP